MRAALGFLTVVGGAAMPDRRALPWFPVVGAALGLVLGLLWDTGDELWAPALVAALVVAADLALTGMLHLDGLADSADGLLPHLDRDRRLAVMSAPDVGAFGIGVVGAVLLLRFAALATGDAEAAVVVAVWTTARAAMAVALTTVPYARGEGLASRFEGGSPAMPAVIGIAIVIAAAVLDPARVTASAIGAAAAFVAVVALARRRLGGFTGDVLGAAGIVGETVGLVVAAARW